MSWTTDNRWSPGSSGAEVPEEAPAAYSARWIDMGDDTPADVLGDRQGFAYDDPADRDRLIAHLKRTGDDVRTPQDWPRNVTHMIRDGASWAMYAHRTAGYIYVDAWLTP